jgi:hypothetical protein
VEQGRGNVCTTTVRSDGGGSITVTVANQSSGYSRTYRLGRWSQQPDSKPLKPGRRKKAAENAAAASS